jgi:hypothetical protein
MEAKGEAPIAVELEWRTLKPLQTHTDLLSISPFNASSSLYPSLLQSPISLARRDETVNMIIPDLCSISMGHMSLATAMVCSAFSVQVSIDELTNHFQ